MSLSGRTAVVTGGSGEIGLAVVRRLARLGVRVAVGYHSSRDSADEVATSILRRGGDACSIQADISTETGPAALIRAAGRRLGPVDILVNGAGVGLHRLAVDTSYAEWRRVLDVNLQGAFLCAKEALPDMVRRGWGRIINIGSIWGEVGAAGEVAYSTGKAGLSGLTKALAKEVARSGVTVNAVAPGVIDTVMNSALDDEERAALRARVPLGRLGTGDDVAGAVAFLASDEAAYVTGHILWVTGGFDPLP